MSTKRVLDLAAERLGILTLARAGHHKLDERELRRLAKSGVLERVAEGVYRATGAPKTYEQDVAIAIAAAGSRAWAAGPCAVRLRRQGIPWFGKAEVEIVVPYAANPRDARLIATVRRTRHLDPVDTDTVGVLPVTAPLRTVVDCIDRVARDGFRALADDVLYTSGRHAAAELRAAFARTRRSRGWPWIDDVLAPWEVEGPAPESPKEMSLVRVLVNAGLPLPQRQVKIRDPSTGRVVARADHGYPEAKVAVEYLGKRSHSIRQAHGDDLRDEDMRALGWVAAYGQARHLVEPGSTEFAELVRQLLRDRAS